MKLRLTKAHSYRGYGITATQESPVVEVEDEATAQALLASGYFREASDPEPEPGQQSGQNPEMGPEPDYNALSAMSKAELTAYAKEHGIDISKCRTKSDILTEISAAYGGSRTMIDLQREPGNQGGD